jgi:hypothetical protein
LITSCCSGSGVIVSGGFLGVMWIVTQYSVSLLFAVLCRTTQAVIGAERCSSSFGTCTPDAFPITGIAFRVYTVENST